MQSEQTKRFREGDVTLGVVGLGYVGLPLAVEAARAGIRVLGFDVQEKVVAVINSGRSHIQDLSDEDVGEHVRAGILEATTDMARLEECDVVSICVPTPLSKTRDPDVSFVLAATESVAAALRPGQLIVLESTTYPGTTRDLLLPALATGAAGGILALANIAPAHCIDIYRSFRDGDMEHARKMQLSAIALNAAVTSKWGVPALKAAMDHLGLYGGPVRRPLLPAGDDTMRALIELLDDKTVDLYKTIEE